jgi:hypothetical protein
MTTLTFAQVKKLLTTVTKSVPDQLNCDGCFDLFGALADAELRGDEPSDALQSDALESVKVHLSQCPCCAYEYATLLEALQEPMATSGESI